ncbi:MAG: hypothetical protein LBI78_07665 [Campylobacteraceae bacterium]|jgi:hypothetical protein|nr:hypothetical protein [Campylobacteraceae bacterium]
MQNIYPIIMFLFFSILFSGCGKGDVSNTSNSGVTSNPSTTITLSTDCSGSNCGSSANAYKGSGIGIWRAKNTQAASSKLDVTLSNVANKEITIVFTNEGDTDVSLSRITVDASLKREMRGNEFTENYNKIIHFEKRVDVKKLLQQSYSINQNQKLRAISPKVWNEGDQRGWLIEPYETLESRTATLKRQTTASDGRTINFWVENSETGKVTDGILSEISGKFLGLYSEVVNLAGKPWGTHKYSNLILDEQPLDIVLANFDKDNRAGGVIGYFFGVNNFLSRSNSNEALALFVDTETLYLSSMGTAITLGTMAHELTHAINFYQRDVLSDDDFDTFLDEMTAIMMEDVLSSQIDPSYSDTKTRYISWLQNPSVYNCDFTYWKDGYYCDGKSVNNYDVAASFGAFLLRQHGIAFYKNIFKTNSDSSISNDRLRSINILGKAIKTYDNGGFGYALQHWGASIALFPVGISPQGFGYPVLNSDGVHLEAFDGNSYRSNRQLPSSSPSLLKAHGHFPFLRKVSSDTYAESFTVPRNVSVTIVVK